MILLVILFSLSVGLLSVLGFWQLDRAEQKRERYENFLARHQSSELRLEKSSTLADLKWRKAVLIGNYEDINLLLDNRVYMKQSGYEVVTPFIFDDVTFKVIKGKVDNGDKLALYKVDGLSGATITSRGVSNMVEYWFGDSGYSALLRELDYES